MSSPGIVIDLMKDEILDSRQIYNNLILVDEEIIDLINCYKILLDSFSNNSLLGPFPGCKHSDIQILIYSISLQNISSKHNRQIIYIFYHNSQFSYYSLKLNDIQEVCRNWKFNLSSNNELPNSLKNISIHIGKLVFTSRYLDKKLIPNKTADINLFVQQIKNYLLISKNLGINFIIDSEDIRKFLLEVFFKTAWDKIEFFNRNEDNSSEIILQKSTIKIIPFNLLPQADLDYLYIFFFKDSYLNDQEMMRTFKEIFVNSPTNSHLIVLIDKISKSDFENTEFFKVLTDPIGKSISFVEIGDKKELIIESLNNYLSSLIYNLERNKIYEHIV